MTLSTTPYKSNTTTTTMMSTTTSIASSSRPTLVIASGNAATIWDYSSSNYDQHQHHNHQHHTHYHPHGEHTIADICWNHNGQVLASCSTVNTDDLMTTMGGGGGPHDFDNVVLTASNSGNVLDSLQHNKEWDAAPLYRRAGITTSIAFGGKSRYLCLGDTSGAVCLWDLKKRTRARQFFLPQTTGSNSNSSNTNNGSNYNPANQVMLDPLDRYVLSLSPSLFSVFNLREGTLATSIVPPSNNYNYTKFCMSQIEPHVAAIGTKDGSILLYDIATAAAMNNKNNIHRQSSPAMPFSTLDRCHESTISGIAISRTNPQLLASSSLDGTLNFIDIKSNELIHGEIVSNNNMNNARKGSGSSCSITCLSLHSDGISCAVGTNTGNIFVYDIRKVNGVVASLSVQDSVTSIQYALPHKSSSSSSKANSSPVRPTTFTTPGGSITPGSESRQQQSNHQTQAQYDSNTMDQSNKMDIGRNVFESNRGQQQHDPTMTGMKGATATTTLETGTTGGTVHTEYQSTAKFSYQGPDDDKLQQNQQQSSQQQTPMIASRQKAQSEPSSPPRIDMSEIRDVVRDEIDNLRDDVEETLRNLHMDMIRQFHIQSQEFNNVLSSHLSTIERLTRENQNLKDEMERLRKEK